MQITHYTDYSLRVLIFLSLQEDKQRVTISDVAEHFKIPRNHLVKVVHQLGILNYIHTTRGKNGGICLGKPADQIRIGEVIRHMENRLDVVDCNSPSLCPIKPGCQLKSILLQAGEAFLSVLDQHTIADLQNKPDQLKTLLHLDVKI
ncbi:Nitrite-sensitive transcriptional repressor NsrR [hydrothermal vent metagenome]|uniref:Nitrite-sensitive transcriptional repressor NsrR n=1 Tax=hydrothermal vent metagenome TaxID=652676 RepID=A0A3B0XXK8_9ZZZZ